MSRRTFTITVSVLFVLILIFLELGPWSSKEIAKYNHGYGTFDMKSYPPDTVYQVLDRMETVGFDIYRKYFIVDSIFTIIFCIVQLLLQSYAYQWSKSMLLHRTLFFIPAARMLSDLIENIALSYILKEYPQRLDTLAGFSSVATRAKLSLVGLWLLLLITGFLVFLVKRRYLAK